MERLFEEARGRGLVIFAGAGLSTAPPTSLPSWWELQSAVLEALGQRVAEVLDEQRALALTTLLLERQKEELLPPEYQAQIIADRLGRVYFEVLRCLDSDVPNASHYAIAQLAHRGHVRAIITTNFDRALETAFARAGVPLEKCAGGAAYEALATQLDRAGAPCSLLQIHGTARDPATLIDTLAQRRIGLPAATLRCIAHLLKNHHWLFVGWSGLDLAAEPNYLGLRAHAQDALGFTWLVRQGTAARREVATLVGAYGDTRARVVHGELPGWLEALARMAGTTGAPSAADGVIAQPGVGMRQAVQNWAAEGDPVRFCLAAADLLKAAGQPDAALELLEAVRTRAQIERPADEPYALLLCALGILRRERGMLDTAEMLFREALPLFRQNQHYFATTLSNLGLVEEARGNWAEAGRIAGEVSVLFEQLDNVRSQAAAQHNAARALFELGHYDEARILYQSELVLVARCGDEPGRAGALQSLGELLIRMGHFDDAGARLNEAGALHARLGDERGRAQTLASLGELDRLRGAWESAQARLLQALTVFERLGSLDDQATTISGLARLAFNDGDFTEALRLFTRELELRERVGGELPAALTRMNVGCVLLARGDLDEARPLLEGACTAFQQLGASNELQLARRNLATLERRTLDWQAP